MKFTLYWTETSLCTVTVEASDEEAIAEAWRQMDETFIDIVGYGTETDGGVMMDSLEIEPYTGRHPADMEIA